MRSRIMIAAASMMAAIGMPDLRGPVYDGGHGHGSAGYATPGAFVKARGGARRSIRRAAQLAKGKFVRC